MTIEKTDSEVKCRTCGKVLKVSFAHCIGNGWPKCCGATMSLARGPKDVFAETTKALRAQIPSVLHRTQRYRTPEEIGGMDMPSIAMPDTSGDVKLTWDPSNPEEVKHAKDHFEKLKKTGHIFFRINPEGKKGDKLKKFDDGSGELICEFDPNADVLATELPRGG